LVLKFESALNDVNIMVESLRVCYN